MWVIRSLKGAQQVINDIGGFCECGIPEEDIGKK